MFRDWATIVFYTVLTAFILILVSIGGVKIYQYFQVGIENQNTKIIRQTNQYDTSAKTHLTKLYSEYMDLNTKIAETNNTNLQNQYRQQQKAIISEMRIQAVTLETSQIPRDVYELLQRNP